MIFTANSDFEKLWGISEREYYSKQYLTFEALEDGAISFNIWYAAGTDVIKSISYSLDDGETWTKTENVDDKEKNLVIDVDVTAGDKILWKGDAIKTSCFDDNEGEDIGSFFSSDCEFKAYGNIMSLLYEDDFEDKNTLNNESTFYGLFYDYNASNECLIVSAKNLILPATTLTEGCYCNMFYRCTNLTNTPQLPATTLANYCYQSMFQNCTSLTTAPELPATTLTNVCYSNMFDSCSSLNKITMLATDISASICLSYWTDGVAEEGTLIINKDYEGLRSALNVPATWTILNEDGTPHIFPRDYSEEYFTIEVMNNNTAFNFTIPTLICENDDITEISYSIDNGNTWTTINEDDDEILIGVQLNAGEKILLKGIANKYSGILSPNQDDSPEEFYSNIYVDDDYIVYGNIMSLFYGDNFLNKKLNTNYTYHCAGLFKNNDCLIDASNLIFPTNILAGSYLSMFQNCTSLTTAPSILPAKTLANYCYYYMFNGCTSLTTPPTLPATTLARSCYNAMFNGCTSLTTAPELPGLTLTSGCYSSMFKHCSNLNYIKALFTTTPNGSYTGDWLSGVSATGTFVKNSAATWTATGAYAVPIGWTVETA